MEPEEEMGMWYTNKANVPDIAYYMHYIQLGSVDTSIASTKGGFAAMKENIGSINGRGGLGP
jgi:hypothetical protein